MDAPQHTNWNGQSLCKWFVLFVFVFLLLSSNVIYFSSTCTIEPMCCSRNENTIESKDEISKYAMMFACAVPDIEIGCDFFSFFYIFFVSVLILQPIQKHSSVHCIDAFQVVLVSPIHTCAMLMLIFFIIELCMWFPFIYFLFSGVSFHTFCLSHTFHYFKTMYVVKILCLYKKEEDKCKILIFANLL